MGLSKVSVETSDVRFADASPELSVEMGSLIRMIDRGASGSSSFVICANVCVCEAIIRRLSAQRPPCLHTIAACIGTILQRASKLPDKERDKYAGLHCLPLSHTRAKHGKHQPHLVSSSPFVSTCSSISPSSHLPSSHLPVVIALLLAALGTIQPLVYVPYYLIDNSRAPDCMAELERNDVTYENLRRPERRIKLPSRGTCRRVSRPSTCGDGDPLTA